MSQLFKRIASNFALVIGLKFGQIAREDSEGEDRYIVSVNNHTHIYIYYKDNGVFVNANITGINNHYFNVTQVSIHDFACSLKYLWDVTAQTDYHSTSNVAKRVQAFLTQFPN